MGYLQTYSVKDWGTHTVMGPCYYRHTDQRHVRLGYTYSHGDLATTDIQTKDMKDWGTHSHGDLATYRHTDQRHVRLGYTYSHGTFVPTDIQTKDMKDWGTHTVMGPSYLQTYRPKT